MKNLSNTQNNDILLPEELNNDLPEELNNDLPEELNNDLPKELDSVTCIHGDESLLYIAIENGETKKVNMLLNCGGVNLNLPRASDGRSPLHMAIKIGNLAIVETLLSHGASPNIPHQTPPLFLASYHGYSSIVEALLKYNADKAASREITLDKLRKNENITENSLKTFLTNKYNANIPPTILLKNLSLSESSLMKCLNDKYKLSIPSTLSLNALEIAILRNDISIQCLLNPCPLVPEIPLNITIKNTFLLFPEYPNQASNTSSTNSNENALQLNC